MTSPILLLLQYWDEYVALCSEISKESEGGTRITPNFYGLATYIRTRMNERVTSEVKHCEPDGIVYLSNPPQNRCKKCGQMWIFGDVVPVCLFTSDQWRDKQDKEYELEKLDLEDYGHIKE